MLMFGITTLALVTACEESKPLVKTPYPRQLVGKRLPLSNDEASSKSAVAKFAVQVEPGAVLEWYRQRGFRVTRDSHDVVGYGPYGLSFWLYGDSRANGSNILLVCRWKDL